MKTSLTLGQKALILVCIPLFFDTVFLLTLRQLLQQSRLEAQEEEHARLMTGKSDALLQHSGEAAAALAGFKFTHQPMFLERYSARTKAAQYNLEELHALANSDRERNLLSKLDRIMKDFFDCLEMTRNFVLGETEAYRHTDTAKISKNISSLRAALDELNTLQLQGRAPMPHRWEQSSGLLVDATVLGIVMNILMAITLTMFFNRGTTKRLKQLMDNTVLLAGGREIMPCMKGSDEIARLDQFFHSMAEELRKTSERERAALDNVSDVICSVDREGNLGSVNSACEQLWGIPAAEMVGTKLSDRVSGAQRDALAQHLKTSEKNGSHTFEMVMTRGDGREIETFWSVNWSAKDQLGYCTAHDITARKEVERMKQELAAMVSHDLRTPVSSALMFLEMLLNGFFGNQTPECNSTAVRLQSSMQRLMMLVSDLLDFEKIEAGKLSLNIGITSLGRIVHRAIDSILTTANVANVELDLNAVKDIAVMADEERIVQVVVNLLANAIKYSPPKSIVILSASIMDGVAQLHIQDNGPGIPKHLQSRIFEPFEQAERSTRSRGGFGLGLAICKRIMVAHNGRVFVESEPSGGSKFTIELPAAVD